MRAVDDKVHPEDEVVIARGREEEEAVTPAGRPLYIYRCNGEIEEITEAETMDLDQDTLRVHCPDCGELTRPRQGVYLCARVKDLPPVPD